ncbi:hypothetical protein LI165_12205, partial [Phascolarctobacterium faecium]
RASQYFYQLFDKDDLRRDWTIASYSYDGKTGEKIDCANNYWMRFCGKFRREYELSNPKDSQYTPINFPVLPANASATRYSKSNTAASRST